MSIQQTDVLYTAVATAENGRDGRVATDDGKLDLVVGPPKEMGGSGAGNGISSPGRNIVHAIG